MSFSRRTCLVAPLSVSLTLVALHVLSAETSVKAGSSLSYKYDDNIRVTPTNKITLSGITLDGYVDAAYATERFTATTYLKLGIERYDSVDLDADNPLLDEPITSDFANESQDFNTEFAYDWEYHTLSMSGRYWRDSTLNTQFRETGLGRLREIEGASKRTTSMANAAWQWRFSERQQLDTTLQWQTVDYESTVYVGYDYGSIVTNWSYTLRENLSLNAQPYFSRFENDATTPVISDTLGFRVGANWSLSEKWQLNALVGAAEVSNEGSGGFFVFNPETRQVEFLVLEDTSNTSFIGDVTLGYDEEYYGFSANVSSAVSPGGEGVLRQNIEAGVSYYWKPTERTRLDIDLGMGRSETTGDRVDDKRDFSETGVRFGYQFFEEWWLTIRYRYRTQEYERNGLGEGKGSNVSVGLSYRLPKEIL